MNNITISQTNTKGQIVIPQPFRNELNITPNTSLLIKVVGSSVVIQPISKVITEAELSQDHFLQTLEKTKGSWQSAPEVPNSEELEVSEANKRVQPW